MTKVTEICGVGVWGVEVRERFGVVVLMCGGDQEGVFPSCGVITRLEIIFASI